MVVQSHKRYIKTKQTQGVENASSTNKTDSLLQFQMTELGANFNQLFHDKKLPFKYRTLVYLQNILFCKEVEHDI